MTHNISQTTLHLAARDGHVEIVGLLLDQGAEINMKDEDGWTALHWAAGNGYLNVVKLLLNRRAEIEAKGKDGQTALHSAAGCGHLKVVRLLLDRGAEIEAKYNYGWTALRAAAVDGHLNVIKLLLDRGAKVEVRDKDGQTALHSAAGYGHLKVVKSLLDWGSEVEVTDKDGQTALHSAAGDGHLAVVRLLLDQGAEIEAKDKDGPTALHSAARGGHLEVVRLLLDRGAEVDVKDKKGWTALHWAMGDRHEAVIKLLLDRGAEIEIKDKGSWTALQWAAGDGYLKVVKLLLDRGAEIEAKDESGQTALHSAAGYGHLKVVKSLLDWGVKVEVTDKDGQTALHSAAGDGHLAVVRLLLDQGAEIEAKDKDGPTALHSAARGGHLEVVRLLLDRGAEIDVKDKKGWTALHWAIGDRHEAVIKLLLDRGAEIDIKDNGSWTALHWAAGDGYLKVVKLLLDRGAKIEAKDKDGQTALHSAARNGHLGVVGLLLDEGAEVDIKDENGCTALHWAAGIGHLKVVKLLLDRGAEVEAKDKDGQTALHSATGDSRLEVVGLLLDQGAKLSEEIVQLMHEQGFDIETGEARGWPVLRTAGRREPLKIVQLKTCPICNNLERKNRDQNSLDVTLEDLRESAEKGCPSCALLRNGVALLPNLYTWKRLRLTALHRHKTPLLVNIEYEGANSCDLEFYTHIGAPAFWPAIGPARDVSEDSSSEECFALAKDWWEECSKGHSECPRILPVQLPTRVINVGSDTQEPRLYETQKNETGTYAALSYCWGLSPPLITNESTIEERKRSIPYDKFPKTLREAITVIRRLSIKYLWIDCLCIIQDSVSDWDKESSQMSAVYSNAFVTIAADGASNCDGGLFIKSEARPRLLGKIECLGAATEKVHVYVRLSTVSQLPDMPSHATKMLSRSILSTRGWALQERLMSPRIIHFTATEMAWECPTDTRCECSCLSGSALALEAQYLSHPRAADTPLVVNKRSPPLGLDWHSLVKEYTQRQLTKPTDRLSAISGLAQKMSQAPVVSKSDNQISRDSTNESEEVISRQVCSREVASCHKTPMNLDNDTLDSLYNRSHYIFGLWLPDMTRDLLWYTVENRDIHRKKLEGYAPSWSWASVIAAIEYPDEASTGGKSRNLFVPDLRVRVDLLDSGSGMLTVHGLLIGGRLNEKSFHFIPTNDKSLSTSFCPDVDSNIRIRDTEIMLYFLAVAVVHRQKLKTYIGLLLERVDSANLFERLGPVLGENSPNVFERVGFVRGSDCDIRFWNAVGTRQDLLII